MGNYTWHHHQETGRMQLVYSAIHNKGKPHTGGHRIWGK
nr:HNH endonuclease [Risungbinella massiliensis]